jgi:hypothetical protein
MVKRGFDFQDEKDTRSCWYQGKGAVGWFIVNDGEREHGSSILKKMLMPD